MLLLLLLLLQLLAGNELLQHKLLNHILSAIGSPGQQQLLLQLQQEQQQQQQMGQGALAGLEKADCRIDIRVRRLRKPPYGNLPCALYRPTAKAGSKLELYHNFLPKAPLVSPPPHSVGNSNTIVQICRYPTRA